MARTATASGSAKTGRAVLGAPILSQSFKLGFLTVRYYALTFVGGIVAGYLISRARAIKQGIEAKLFDDIIFWAVVIGFISARIYYVLFYFDQYKNNLSEVYKVWHGGLAIYGGLIGAVIAIYFLCKKYSLDFWKFADAAVLGVPIAQAIGRFGNFLNYEAFGKPTNLPWKMFVPFQFRPAGYQQYAYFHPTFAYEAIWDVLTFLVLLLLIKFFIKRGVGFRTDLKVPRTGLVLGVYLVAYSVGRFLIEGIRLDSAFFGPFRGDQITSLLLILAGLGIIISRYVPQSNQ